MEANGTANGEVKKVTELTSIYVECFPSYSGPRVSTDKRVGDKAHKYSISLPAPKDAEEFAKIYGEFFTFPTAIDMGVRQRAYDDGNSIKNLCDEAVLKDGNDPNDEEMIDAVREAMEEAMSREATKRTGGAAKRQREAGKKAESEAANLGMSVEEMIALAKEAAVLKAQAE